MARALALVTALVALLAPLPAGAGSARPVWAITVEVRWGAPRGPESLRQELLGELLGSLRQHRCFRSVERSAADERGKGDLLLILTLDDYAQETEYDTSLAERASPEPGTDAPRPVARIGALVRMELREPDATVPLRHKSFRHEESFTPLTDSDPRAAARGQFVLQVVRRARSFSCKGPPKAWIREHPPAAR